MIYEKMKKIRTDNLITQKKMAEILKVSRSTYAGWENGIDSIPIIKLNDYCNYFNVSLDYICEITSKKNYENIKKELDIKELGKRINQTRLSQNDTQKTISNILNVDQSNYSKYELGKIIIRTYTLIEFAKHYKVSIDWLCGKIENNPNKTKNILQK